jgi:hypothetical protein
MPKMTHYASRYADAFAKFVNAPQQLLRLWAVNSKIKTLQHRQRVTLARVVRLMLSFMADNNQVGICKADAMHGITHTNLIKRYAVMFGETITEGRWYRAIKQLVDAGYLTSVHATIVDNTESALIRSIASMKQFTDLFFSDLNLEHKKDIRESRAKSTASRINKGLSNIWSGYKIFNARRKKPLESILTEPASYDEVPTSFDDGIFI